MFTNYWTGIVIAVFFSTITSALPAPYNNEEAISGLRSHQKRIFQFKCSNPQERSYKIKPRLPIGALDTNEVVFPLHTVIRTCDEGAGCCDAEDRTCAPAVDGGLEYEEVVVKVSRVVGNHSTSYRTLKIEHHKKCECRLRSEYTPSEPTITFVD